uniref:MOSC domain-containing protein n=1 Tax=Candidatus Kentrum sp. MB TaxID=2138164 RepID=A0A451BG27_9GAMM|nr:MAG: hypothetical protein BECKMB1821I_GA0114274_11106 [Candidatus Kentron sp. MB]VFK77226.1 MAG: hypothetical protein BECKMB1821H_GA0114242_11126 [Candidatus Kentron sp. MB]
MLGEKLHAADITPKGIRGDRFFALLDVETGKIVSAKNPRKWPHLFSFHARYEETGSNIIRITLPDGTTIRNDDAELDSMLSIALGRKVRLISQVPDKPRLEEYWPDIEEVEHRDMVITKDAPKDSFYALAVIHLLTTSTLDELHRLSPEGHFEACRFRPNIVITTEQTGFVENQWIGKTLTIGNGIRLNITGPCPRCVVTTLAQNNLPKDTDILKAAVRHNGGNVGVYAEVVKDGTIQCGDVVLISPH